MQLRDHDAIKSKRDFFMVDPRLLQVEDGYNVRDLDTPETREHIAGLKESIRPNGVKVPLEVRLRGDAIVVVAGHCRLAAVMELIAEGEEIKAVPCIPEPKETSEEDRVLNLAISNSGKPLAPLEMAQVVRRLVAFGWEKGDIAKRIGWKSTASVSHHLDMLAMPTPIKDHVRKGEISATLASKISKNADPDIAAKLIRDNIAENERLNGKRRATPKTHARAAGKARPESDPPPERKPAASLAETVLDHAAGADGPIPDTPTAAPAHPPADVDPPAQVAAGASVAPAPAFRQSIKHLIDALEPFASLAHEHDFAERSDDDLIEVPFRHMKQAWIVFAKATGETQ